MKRPLKNRILTEICNEYPFSISDVAVSWERLKSYDALIAACEVASKEGFSQLTDYISKRFKGKPTVVCLCGSTRFYEAFMKANYEETMKLNIVLSVGFFVHSSGQAHGEQVGCTPEQKKALDELHLRKIDLADEVLILNVNGYIGESTRRELEYARAHGKHIRFLEPDKAE